MKQISKMIAAALSSTLAFTSCVKEVINDEAWEKEPTKSVLQIQTRGANDAQPVAQGRLYLFDKNGSCVGMLDVDTETPTATESLPIGKYQVYAVGSDHLDRFSLPDREDASPESVISLKAESTMCDLLMKHDSVTLVKNQEASLNLTLERKVICIDSICIHQVPDSISNVSVSISDLYTQIQLDGEHPDVTAAYETTLTEQEDGKTWKTEPGQMSFPSKGRPVIRITFTGPNSTSNFAFTANSAFTANHKVGISGKYTETGTVVLLATLNTQEWDEPTSVIFNFNDSAKVTSTPDPSPTPSTTTLPTVGSTYQGLYVISVNETTRVVTLLSSTEKNHIDETADASSHKTSVNNAIKSWEEFANLTGTTRVPTVEEFTSFASNNALLPLNQADNKDYYCINGSTLKTVNVKKRGDEVVIDSPGTVFVPATYLKPVIDITIE